MKKILILSTLVLIHSTLWAIPSTINYQGTLRTKGVPTNQPTNMTFVLVSQDGKTAYSNSINAQVTPINGLFSTQLNFDLVAPYTWDTITPYLQVSVEKQILSPLEPVTATAYSIVSSAVIDNAITTSKIANGAVTAAKLDSSVQNILLPPGMIVAYAGNVPPAGWLLCDGASVSRTTYANLFSAITTTWGAGDSISTFNLPDLRGRTPIGAGQATGLTNRTLGRTLGEESHTLTVTEIPANLTVNDPGHVHSITDPGHVHTYLNGAVTEVLGDTGASYGAQGGVQKQFQRTGVDTAKTGISVNANFTGIAVGGGGTSHNIMQPSAVVNFIIKT